MLKVQGPVASQQRVPGRGLEDWAQAGHKKDCKRARMLKFEDYLNAA